MQQIPLEFKIIAQCPVTKARSSLMKLPHSIVPTPIFMPVGTSGAMKGVTTLELEHLDCPIILGNTYHLSLQPGELLLKEIGGLHKFMNWKNSLLTDSGGFQMVSLVSLSEVSEEGVEFESPFDKTKLLLTPEKSIEIQNAIGADIMMQLDDVVSSLIQGPRVEEAMWRSIRWLDRCIAANQRPTEQNLFPIIQGGLDPELRRICIKEMIKRPSNGFAVGGLSGGESKDQFWRIVSLCTDLLPIDKPRYCMGVGYAEDLVVCSALGVDMFDCVFPTRTARFGNALTSKGPLHLKKVKYIRDFTPIEEECNCPTCKTQTRAIIYKLLENNDAVGVQLISIHNISYQLRLMKDIRTSIENGMFPEFVRKFMRVYYKNGNDNTHSTDSTDPGKVLSERGYPIWIENALKSVNIELESNETNENQ